MAVAISSSAMFSGFLVVGDLPLSAPVLAVGCIGVASVLHTCFGFLEVVTDRFKFATDEPHLMRSIGDSVPSVHESSQDAGVQAQGG